MRDKIARIAEFSDALEFLKMNNSRAFMLRVSCPNTVAVLMTDAVFYALANGVDNGYAGCPPCDRIGRNRCAICLVGAHCSCIYYGMISIVIWDGVVVVITLPSFRAHHEK